MSCDYCHLQPMLSSCNNKVQVCLHCVFKGTMVGSLIFVTTLLFFVEYFSPAGCSLAIHRREPKCVLQLQTSVIDDNALPATPERPRDGSPSPQPRRNTAACTCTLRRAFVYVSETLPSPSLSERILDKPQTHCGRSRQRPGQQQSRCTASCAQDLAPADRLEASPSPSQRKRCLDFSQQSLHRFHGNCALPRTARLLNTSSCTHQEAPVTHSEDLESPSRRSSACLPTQQRRPRHCQLQNICTGSTSKFVTLVSRVTRLTVGAALVQGEKGKFVQFVRLMHRGGVLRTQK